MYAWMNRYRDRWMYGSTYTWMVDRCNDGCMYECTIALVDYYISGQICTGIDGCMDQQIHEYTDAWVVGCMGGQIQGQMHVGMNICMDWSIVLLDRCMDGCEYAWIDSCMDEWMHGSTDLWMDGFMDRQMHGGKTHGSTETRTKNSAMFDNDQLQTVLCLDLKEFQNFNNYKKTKSWRQSLVKYRLCSVSATESAVTTESISSCVCVCVITPQVSLHQTKSQQWPVSTHQSHVQSMLSWTEGTHTEWNFGKLWPSHKSGTLLLSGGENRQMITNTICLPGHKFPQFLPVCVPWDVYSVWAPVPRLLSLCVGTGGVRTAWTVFCCLSLSVHSHSVDFTH